MTKDCFDSKLDAQLAAQRAHLDLCFAEFQEHMDKHFDRTMAKLDRNFRFMIITQPIIIVAVVWPYVERLMSL